MLGYLILLFTIVPVVELALLIKAGQYIGLGNTLAIVIVTGIAGAYLARLQGFLILRKIEEEVNQGRMPADKLFDGVLILCGGILLLTPGFVTDLIGFMGLIPPTRNLFKQWLKRKIKGMINKGEVITIAAGRFR
ncbi:MAG: membrane protein FxsA [Candidatus Omnitrophica bacterium]|nr:membrane protein FxsA [Candidatus Omnitrophota bacterium]